MLRTGLALAAVVLQLTGCSGSEEGGGRTGGLTPDTSIEVLQPKASLGVVEMSISGIGTNAMESSAVWVGPGGLPVKGQGGVPRAVKTITSTSAIPLGLDVSPLSSSHVDVGARGAGGVRYIMATYRVRNARVCADPGNCTAYGTARNNVTFFGITSSQTINQTAVSRFRRFDGSDANAALTTQLVPVHGVSSDGATVVAAMASMQAYREVEIPAADSGVDSVFPYGFVVRNASNDSRVLPANPAPGVYDGVVTLAFRIPLQAQATDDPFSISMRFQVADDTTIRVTQSSQEQTIAGDRAAQARAAALGSKNLAVLGGRIARTTIGDPICQVRIAGLPGAASAYLTNTLSSPPAVNAAPFNLVGVPIDSEVSLGFCEPMNAPTASTLIVQGSMSGLRKVGMAYSGALDGGGATTRPNQLIWSFTGAKPFFRGERVMVSATADNTAVAGTAVRPVVGSFMVQGSVGGSSGSLASRSDLIGHSFTHSVQLGDLNGDGVLDLVTAYDAPTGPSFTVALGDGAGGFGTPTAYNGGNYVPFAAIGDMNGDGHLDVVSVQRDDRIVKIWLGDGTGALSYTGKCPIADGTWVALGDLDADGRLDMVVTNRNHNTVSVLSVNDNGDCRSGKQLAATGGPFSAALGDLNGDGYLDLVTANIDGGSVSIFLGDGSGGFGTRTDRTVGAVNSSPRIVALGDLNGDGVLDLAITVSVDDLVAIHLGNGSGGFTTGTPVTVGDGPTGLELADMNGDGVLDLVVSNQLASTVVVRPGDGAGGFLATTVTAAVGGGPYHLVVGDVDGDGKLDVLTASYDQGVISRLLGQ
jgi:hypothetical protein